MRAPDAELVRAPDAELVRACVPITRQQLQFLLGYTGTRPERPPPHQTLMEGAEIIVRMAQIGPDGPTGGYFDRHGPVPR